MHLIMMLLIVSASQRIESCHCAYVNLVSVRYVKDMQEEQEVGNVV